MNYKETYLKPEIAFLLKKHNYNIKPGPKIKEYLDKSLDIIFDNPYITKDEILNKLKEIKN